MQRLIDFRARRAEYRMAARAVVLPVAVEAARASKTKLRGRV